MIIKYEMYSMIVLTFYDQQYNLVYLTPDSSHGFYESRAEAAEGEDKVERVAGAAGEERRKENNKKKNWRERDGTFFLSRGCVTSSTGGMG